MKKAPLYSRSRPGARHVDAAVSAPAKGADPGPSAAAAASAPVGRRGRFKTFLFRHERRVWAGAVLLLVAAGVMLTTAGAPQAPPLTIAQIDAAMRKSIEETPLPSPV